MTTIDHDPPKHIVILGSGGHGREVAEVLRNGFSRESMTEVLGFIDDDPLRHRTMVDGLRVLGGWDWFEKHGDAQVRLICAVGDPPLARRLVRRAHALGLVFTNAISGAAHISPLSELGVGVVVFPNVVINTGAVIGNYVTINVGASISHDAVVGDFTNLNPGARLAGGVVLGECCYIGMGASVIQGIRVGPSSTIGAGAVVIGDIPPNATAVGVPARVIKTHAEGGRT